MDINLYPALLISFRISNHVPLNIQFDQIVAKKKYLIVIEKKPSFIIMDITDLYYY